MSRALPPLTFLLATVLVAAAWPAAPASAQVRRCVDAQGIAVYTDRPCETMQAAPREVPQDPSVGATLAPGFAVRGCARRPETLLNGVRGALEARDVNRLANWYHWTGTGSGTARALMDELEAIAKRPLVSAELVYPQAASVDPAFPATAYPTDVGIDRNTGRTGNPADGLALPTPAQAQQARPEVASGPEDPAGRPPSGAESARPAPVTPEPAVEPESLRVQQMRGEADIEAVSVRFALRQNAGCWWIEL